MLNTSTQDGILIVEVKLERLDANVAAEFQDQFGKVITQSDDTVLMDLTQVSFMDSSGLAAFVFCFQSGYRRNSLAICGASEKVRSLFKLTRIDQFLKIFENRAEAVASLSATN